MRKFRLFLAQFFSAVRIMRGPFVVAVIAFAVLAFPPQMHELYRVLAHDWQAKSWQIGFGFVTLLMAGGLVWYCARQVTLLRHMSALARVNLEGAMLRWMPRLAGALVPLGAAIGLFLASQEADATETLIRGLQQSEPQWGELGTIYGLIQWSPDRLRLAALACAGMALLLVLLPFARTWHRNWKYDRPATWLLSNRITLFAFVLAVLGVLAFSFGAPALPQAIGTLAIVNLFVMVLVVLVSSVLLLSDKTQIPVLGLLIVWVLALTVVDANDNHVVPLVRHDLPPESEEKTPGNTTAKAEFQAWYESRKDRAHYAASNDPYPVFIVAAAGGGAYAAHYTAAFLAKMQDRCPNFAQHVFMISGVSGGSLGATVFASLAKYKAKNEDYQPCTLTPAGPGPFERATDRFFQKDFLAPVVGSALFPDFAQRFIPLPILPFDRSRALDAAFEQAWRAAADELEVDPSKPNPFERPFLDLWSGDDPDAAVPDLVLNTTEVANGYSVVISPFDPDPVSAQWSKSDQFHRSLPEIAGGKAIYDIKLSTAAGISARFPLLLPAATINIEKVYPKPKISSGGKVFAARDDEEERVPARARLVDGGYVESSAVDTANEVRRLLEFEYIQGSRARASGTPVPKFYLIFLSGYEGIEAPERNLGVISVPMRALISTWQSRGDLAFMRAVKESCPFLSARNKDNCYLFGQQQMIRTRGYSGRAPVEAPIEPVFLNLRDFRLPLAWQLSEATRQIIKLHAGVAERCRLRDVRRIGWPERSRKLAPAEQTQRRMEDALGENNCAACMMQFKLAEHSLTPDWAGESDGRICLRAVAGAPPPPPPPKPAEAQTAPAPGTATP